MRRRREGGEAPVDAQPQSQLEGAQLEGAQLEGAQLEGAQLEGAQLEGARPTPPKKPLYPRLLRLKHIAPNAWQRAVLGEGAIGAGVLLAMADLASAWSIVVLPVAVAAVVKAHDALQGLLERH